LQRSKVAFAKQQVHLAMQQNCFAKQQDLRQRLYCLLQKTTTKTTWKRS
jgi:hypothetical protein